MVRGPGTENTTHNPTENDSNNNLGQPTNRSAAQSSVASPAGPSEADRDPSTGSADTTPRDDSASSQFAAGASAVVKASQLSYLGLFFGIAILIGCLFGRWLDQKFGTQPWLMMVGVLFGIAASFKELYRVTAPYRTEQKKKP